MCPHDCPYNNWRRRDLTDPEVWTIQDVPDHTWSHVILGKYGCMYEQEYTKANGMGDESFFPSLL